MIRLLATASIACLAFGSVADSAPIVIDDFASNPDVVIDLHDPGETPTEIVQNGAGGLFDNRILSANALVGGLSVLSVDTGNTKLSSTAGATTSTRNMVTWSGTSTNGGPIDLTGGGTNDLFALNVVDFNPATDDSDVVFTISVTSGMTTASKAIVIPFNVSVPTLLTYSFTDFGAAATVFEAADAVTLKIEGGPGADVSVDFLSATAIPLPAALPMAVGAFGLLGFIGWRRRQAA